jgi:hypothetical protein
MIIGQLNWITLHVHGEKIRIKGRKKPARVHVKPLADDPRRYRLD